MIIPYWYFFARIKMFCNLFEEFIVQDLYEVRGGKLADRVHLTMPQATGKVDGECVKCKHRWRLRGNPIQVAYMSSEGDWPVYLRRDPSMTKRALLISLCASLCALTSVQAMAVQIRFDQAESKVACAPNNIAYWVFQPPGNPINFGYTVGLAVDENGKPLSCDQARNMLEERDRKKR